MAFKILLHTFRMIFGNFGQALKVSVGPYAILIGAMMILVAIAGTAGNGSVSQGYTTLALLPLVLLPAVFFVTAWVAVSWHRFILLEEYTSLLPAVQNRPIWSYAGKAILLGLIVGLAAVPIFLIMGLFSMGPMSSSSNGSILGTLLFFGIAMIALSVIAIRLGVALVGTALGKPMPFGDAFRATSSLNGTIVLLSILLAVINIVPSAFIGYFMLSIPAIATILNFALQWLVMMLGISILTTIYGHVIEDRPLVS